MRIFIVAGGTGGHMYPGIAAARELVRLRKEGAPPEIRFIVRRGDLGRAVIEREGFIVDEIEGQGFPRQLNSHLFTFPFKLLSGWFEAIQLLKKYPAEAVLGMGGYLTFPVLLSARFLGIRTMIHEQNVLPGLANRWLARWVDRIGISFEESRAYFPKDKVIDCGLPIRADIGTIERPQALKRLGLPEDSPVILVFGGSLGAQKLNEVVCDVWQRLASDGKLFHVFHITGERHLSAVQERYRRLQRTDTVVAYCHQMPEAYAASRMVICRSGASTVAELEAAQRPAILIPYPFASDNHQLFNAQVLEKHGQASILEEKNLTVDSLTGFIEKMFKENFLFPEGQTTPSDAALRLAQALVE